MESRKDRSSSTMEIKDVSGTKESGVSLAASIRARQHGRAPLCCREYCGSEPGSLSLGLGRFLRQQVELVRHPAEFRERCGLDLVHHVAPMNFHRRLGNAHVAGNLLVQPALNDLDQDRALS